MGIVEVGIGFMMLLAGRPAYWVFVGGITFLVGSYFTRQQIVFSWSWNNLALALVLSLAGIALAFSFNRWAARIAGFIAGGYLMFNIPNLLGAQKDFETPIYFVIAGTAAFVFLMISFDVGMVVISSFVASTMILTNIHLGNLDQSVMFIMLVAVSIITQYLVMLYIRPSPD